MKGKQVVLAIFILFLVASGIYAIYYFDLVGIAQQQFTRPVYKAFFGRVCCEEGAFEPAYIRYTDDVSLYKCDAYTDECHLEIFLDRDLGFVGKSVMYQICDINGNNCGSKIAISWQGYSKADDKRSFRLDYGQSIKFSPYSFPSQNDWEMIIYSAKYRKFYIQGVENGKVFVAKSCILNPELKQRVLAGGLNELSKTGANRCQNYITDFVLVSTNTYTSSYGEVLCQARNLYYLDTITLLDGSSRTIQGTRITDVECCPNEPNCDIDFKFKEVVIKECDYSYQCANAGEPVSITGTSYVTFNCIENKCVQSDPIVVECTNNAICVDKYNDPNSVCVNFKCEVDDVWIGHCGDGVCDSVIGETPTSCPDDCGQPQMECEWWQEYYTKDKCGLLCQLGFGQPITVTGCKLATWVYIVVGSLIGGIILLVVILRIKPKKRRRR